MELCKTIGTDKLIAIADAGKERRDSVRNGLAEFEARNLQTDALILVHDAARPFLSPDVILRNIEGAARFGACCTVIPSTDTPIVSANGNTIDQMPPRSQVYMSQTPQSFHMELLLRAHDTVPKDAPNVTDDCSLVRSIGHAVHLVQGTDTLFKITRAQDLMLAQHVLEEKDD